VPAERARNFSLLAMGFSISGFVGPLAAGIAIDHFGFTATFALLAVVPFIPLFVLLRGRLTLPGPVAPSGTHHHGGVRALMRHRMLRRALLLNAFFAVGWDLHLVFVPIYGARIGLSASSIGLVLAAFAAATFIVRLLIPALSLRITEHRILAGALFVAGGAYVAYPFATGLAALLPLSFGLGLALGTGQPMIMALLHTHAPPGRMGEAGGIRMSLINTMSFVFPLAFGAVGAALGLAPVFWSVGACLGAAGLVARREAKA
jgi:MFS family permease